MSLFIVTLKLDKNPEHNPRQKIQSNCPLQVHNLTCTDSTGEHHSILIEAELESDIYTSLYFKKFHITRIEQVQEILKVAEK